MKACELEKGTIVELGGELHTVERVSVQTPSARGAATLYKVRFRNIRTRGKVDRTFKGDEGLVGGEYETRSVDYSYRDGDCFVFMDEGDFSVFELRGEEVGGARMYLREGQEKIRALIRGGKVLCIQLPDSVDLGVVECAPAMRGASVTARTKTAKLETGLEVQVPEYVACGERVRVDTRTGEFIQRVQ